MAEQKKPPVSSKQELWEKNRLAFAKLAAVTLSELNKAESKTYSIYTKEDYRTYIENPKSNEVNLRNMSRYFYLVSTAYRRLCKYYAEIPLLYWTVIPQTDLQKPDNPDKVKKNYQKVLTLLNNMNMQHEFRKLLTVAWREDVAYGYIYSSTDSWFIDLLDPDYCRIVQVEDGCLNFAFDFSYYDRRSWKLESADPDLQRMYQLYRNDIQNMRWQLLDSKKTICIKVNDDSLTEVVPPMSGIFEDLIDLLDYRSLLRNREEIQNYVLLLQRVPIDDNSEGVDNFLLDMDTVIQFDAKLQASVPDQVGVATTPMEITPIQFKNDTPEVDLLSKATRSMFDNAGTSQMLFNSDKSGKVGLDASIHTDEMMAFEVMRQLERWVRRYIKQNVSGSKFIFNFLDISPFNKDSFISTQRDLATIGVPNKLTLCAANGMNPLETFSAAYFENDVMNIIDSFVPLNTSFTQSSAESEPGRPQMDESELSDSGMQTRDDAENTDTIET